MQEVMRTLFSALAVPPQLCHRRQRRPAPIRQCLAESVTAPHRQQLRAVFCQAGTHSSLKAI